MGGNGATTGTCRLGSTRGMPAASSARQKYLTYRTESLQRGNRLGLEEVDYLPVSLDHRLPPAVRERCVDLACRRTDARRTSTDPDRRTQAGVACGPQVENSPRPRAGAAPCAALAVLGTFRILSQATRLSYSFRGGVKTAHVGAFLRAVNRTTPTQRSSNVPGSSGQGAFPQFHLLAGNRLAG